MSDNKKTKSRNPSTRHLLGLLSLLFSVIALVIASKPLLLHTNDNMQNKLSAISSHSMQLQNQIQLLQQQFTELENKSQQPAISEKDRSIIFTLDSIKQQLLDLNLTPRQAQNNDSQPKPSSTIKENTTWKERLHHALNKLKSFVKVQHTSHPIKAMLSASDYLSIKLLIASTLTQTQWAVIASNQALYQHTLAQAESMLQRYFSHFQAQTQPLTVKIQVLKRRELDINELAIKAPMSQALATAGDIIAPALNKKKPIVENKQPPSPPQVQAL